MNVQKIKEIVEEMKADVNAYYAPKMLVPAFSGWSLNCGQDEKLQLVLRFALPGKDHNTWSRSL